VRDLLARKRRPLPDPMDSRSDKHGRDISDASLPRVPSDYEYESFCEHGEAFRARLTNAPRAKDTRDGGPSRKGRTK